MADKDFDIEDDFDAKGVITLAGISPRRRNPEEAV